MRGMSIGYTVGGALLAVLGIGLLVWSVTSDSLAASGLGIAGVTLIVVGVIFFLVGRYIKRLSPTATLENGVAGMAQVLSVQDTGVTFNERNAVIKAQVMVTLPGEAPYPGELKVVLGRTQWGALQPGMTIPVKVDPVDRSKIAFDQSRPVLSGAAPAGAGAPGGQAFGQQVTTMSAADIIARGIASDGTLLGIEPTGLTAGQALPGLPPEVADDPIFKVIFTFMVQGQGETRSEALLRVPDGKAAALVPNARIPIRYLEGQPNTATIDWTRL